MKKGCFLSVIGFLTILVIVVFYVVKFHGEDLLELGKDKLVEMAQNKIENDISNLQNGEYADSLKIVIGKYFENINKMNVTEELETIERFADEIEIIMMDSKIDSAEFDFITKLLTKHEQ